MTTYKAPLREFRFVLEELLDIGQLARLPGYEDATPEIFASVLEEGGKLCEEVLFPLNRSGDEEGCTYENGVVRTPKGFKEAYKAFCEGGGYTITGIKIFISAGEHDLTDNILHLVLARLPDAPAGIRGISLFLVPKFLVAADGALGQRNGVRCGSIEHKMGIKASSTCVMNFDEAEGYLVGKPHAGMRAMFTMMNAARLGVAVQGLGIGQTAYPRARAYAAARPQGRALGGAAA